MNLNFNYLQTIDWILVGSEAALESFELEYVNTNIFGIYIGANMIKTHAIEYGK